jgi:hypothetical protein
MSPFIEESAAFEKKRRIVAIAESDVLSGELRRAGEEYSPHSLPLITALRQITESL